MYVNNEKYIPPKCDVCGKFISSSDIKDKKAKFNFKPLDEFGPEESSWTHKKCM